LETKTAELQLRGSYYQSVHSRKLLRGLVAVVISAVAVVASPTDLALSVSSEIDDGFYEDDRYDDGFQGVRFREQPPWESLAIKGTALPTLDREVKAGGWGTISTAASAHLRGAKAPGALAIVH
jgi:hypothetical protein